MNAKPAKKTGSGTGPGTGTGGAAKKPAESPAAGGLRKAKAALEAGRAQEARGLFSQLVADHPDSDEAADAREKIAEIDGGSEPGTLTTVLYIVAAFGFWGFIIYGFAALFDAWDARAYWSANWIYIVIGVVLFGLLVWMVDYAEKKLPQMSENAKNMTLVFGVVPLILIALGAITFLAPYQQKFVIETTFITVVCALPAATYYLFLKSRRLGILNEFIGNLSHFSLYEKRAIYSSESPGANSSEPLREESDRERQLRIEGYLQRFEAMYGQLHFDDGRTLRKFTAALIKASQPEAAGAKAGVTGTGDGGISMPSSAVRIADIFQANLVIPLGLVTILSGVGWMMAIHPVWDATNADFRLTLDLTPVNFAFFGAYFFGIQMLFRRFVIRDLGPNAFMSFAVRIIMAVIAVWVAALCLQIIDAIGTNTDDYAKIALNLTKSTNDYSWPPFLLVLAFVIGFFPQVLWQVIKSLFSMTKLVSIILPETEQDQPLSQLDGLTIWHAARLEEEDIENVGNMATVDIVDIMLRTQIPAERLVSWVDQAILYSVLGAKQGNTADAEATVTKLRKLGIRNASQFIANYNDVDKKSKALNEAFGGDNDKTNPIHTIACSIGKEANFQLVRAWRGV
ncbi:tol-pal system YbgF family protein [Hoeflea sp. TYP-13]|uniref:tol-pal system YbgF family protein n=1 Tax=Hoeflea sp. TYP-13 TaxID=3230023 RepID=UPI0034C635A9